MSILSKKQFNEKVERLLSNGRAGVVDAILRVCDDHALEPESAKRLLSDPLKQKLEAEAKSLNLINRGKSSQGTLTSFYSK